MGNLVINILENFGYAGVFFLIAVENLFPPIPSEVILTFGGFFTTISSLNALSVIIVATLGSLLGAIILYYAGSLIKVKKDNLSKSQIWFDKYGELSILIGRFIPIIRSLISIPAGTYKVNMLKFIVYTTIGSLIWNTTLIYAGVLLGSNWQIFASFISKYSKCILIILIIFIAIKIFKKINRKKSIF